MIAIALMAAMFVLWECLILFEFPPSLGWTLLIGYAAVLFALASWIERSE